MGTMEAPLPTPASVWAGFDPIAGPLEENILRYISMATSSGTHVTTECLCRAWTEDGVAHKEVFFSA